MQFSDITGLHSVKKSLIHAAQEGQIAHAQLFLGPEGSANLAMALAYTAYLNGDQPQPDGSLMPGPATEKLRKFIHPDVHFVFPVGAAKGKSGKDVVSDSFLKEWREFVGDQPYGNLADWSQGFGAENKQLNISKEESRNIIRKLSLKSFEGKYKVVILWMPELLHPSAANGILKVLEEPPDNTLFLLVAHDAEKLLPTILSRTQIVSIPAFSDQEILGHLAKIEGIQDPQDRRMERLRQIANLADGNLRAALQLLSEVEEDNHQVFRDWMRLCYTQQYQKLLSLVDQIHKMGKEAQKGLMQYGLSMMRESLMMLAADELPSDDAELLTHERQLIRIQGEELKFV
ncbi:MAG: ATP-binding protein, partial [Cyclobacteriaceae bacterium]